MKKSLIETTKDNMCPLLFTEYINPPLVGFHIKGIKKRCKYCCGSIHDNLKDLILCIEAYKKEDINLRVSFNQKYKNNNNCLQKDYTSKIYHEAPPCISIYTKNYDYFIFVKKAFETLTDVENAIKKFVSSDDYTKSSQSCLCYLPKEKIYGTTPVSRSKPIKDKYDKQVQFKSISAPIPPNQRIQFSIVLDLPLNGINHTLEEIHSCN